MRRIFWIRPWQRENSLQAVSMVSPPLQRYSENIYGLIKQKIGSDGDGDGHDDIFDCGADHIADLATGT